MTTQEKIEAYLADVIGNPEMRVNHVYSALAYMFSAHYVCKDESCNGDAHRDADTLQEVGDPYCPVCEGEMIPA